MPLPAFLEYLHLRHNQLLESRMQEMGTYLFFTSSPILLFVVTICQLHVFIYKHQGLISSGVTRARG